MSRALGFVLRATVPMVLLAGCSAIDPLEREGVWNPIGANASNLRAMVAVPSDLVQGRAAQYSDGNQAAKAVARWRDDRVYPLPDNNISKVGRGSGGAPAAPAAPAAGAGGQ